MNFTIYTMGDATFLEEVFNSIAMISGAGAIGQVASIGALLAILMMGFRSIMDSRAIPFQELIIGFIIYMICFYPTTTVTIEDAYTGNVHPVSNVPIGPAAAGWVISSIGYKLTQIGETGYRYNSYATQDTAQRFAEPLQMLMMLRSATYNPHLMHALSQSVHPEADLRQSWENYIKECVLIKIDQGIMSKDELYQGDIERVLRSDSQMFGTHIYIGAGGQAGQGMTCADAYERLSDVTFGSLGMAGIGTYDNVLFNMLTRGDTSDPQEALYGSGFKVIEDAGQAVLGAAFDAQKYMRATVLLPVFEEAVDGKYRDMLDANAAIAFRQSLQQRNTQWAQEQSAFLTVIRPAMTFFEGFIYAITPFLAILFVMGKFGFGLVGKYVQTLFWLQLWLPILSICNLYIRNAAEKQMLALTVSPTGAESWFASFYAANTVPEVMETWLGIGGMLAASTPILAFFLVSGSSYAFTNLAGRLGGQDNFDEKLSTPDTMRTGPAMEVAPMLSGNMAKGMTGSGANFDELSFSQLSSDAVKSAQTDYSEASQGFSNTWNNTFGKTITDQNGFQAIQALSSSGVFSSGKTTGVSESTIAQIANKHGVSQEVVEQSINQGTAAMSLGLSAKGIGGVISNSISNNDSISNKDSYMQDIGAAVTEAVQNGADASIRSQITNAVTSNSSLASTLGLSRQDTEALARSQQQMEGARSSFERASSLQDSITDTRRMGYDFIGQQLRDGNSLAQLDSIMGGDSALNAEALRVAGIYQSDGYGMSPDAARAAGMFAAIRRGGNGSQKAAALALLAGKTGAHAPSVGSLDNSGLAGAVNSGGFSPLSVRDLEDKSGVQVGTANLESAYQGWKGALGNNGAIDENARASLMHLHRNPAHDPSPNNVRLGEASKSHAERTSLRGASLDGRSPSEIGREYFQDFHEKSRMSEQVNNILSGLPSGVSEYAREVLLHGNYPEYTDYHSDAYQALRNDFAVGGVISPAQEQEIQMVKDIIDRNSSSGMHALEVEMNALKSYTNLALNSKGRRQ